MDKIAIRHAVLTDIPYLYEVCLKTGNEGNDASALFSDPYLIGHYYVAPYLLYQKGFCFIAEYKNRPQGYIVAVPDTVSFRQWMEEYWLPPLRNQYPQPFPYSISEKEKKILDLIHLSKYPVDLNSLPWISEFPAHLHIDLLPIIQRKGIGSKLMDNIFNELRKQNIPGIYLNVDLSNPGAISFYQKLGFSVIKKQEWGYTMGKLIEK